MISKYHNYILQTKILCRDDESHKPKSQNIGKTIKAKATNSLSRQDESKIVSMIRKQHNHNCRQTRGIVRKSHTTIKRHQEDKQSKETSSFFPIKIIAKLEWTQTDAQQNIEQLQNPKIGVTINNKSTTTKLLP